MKKQFSNLFFMLLVTFTVLVGFAFTVNADATAKVNGVTVLVNGVEQTPGSVYYDEDDKITLVFYGENFNKLNTNYKYKIGSRSGNIGTYGFFTVDTASTPHTATKTFESSQVKHSFLKSISYTNAGESETVTDFTLEYGTTPVVPTVAKVTGVKVKLNDVEQEVGEINAVDDDEITVVFYGENFDKLTTDYRYKIGSATGPIGTYGFFTVDTNAIPHTATRTFPISQVKHSAEKSICYTNADESETVSGYTLVYAADDEPVVTAAKINGVTVKVNGVEQALGELSIADGDEITVIYYGENFDKLNSNYKYKIGPTSGTIGKYGFFTVDIASTPHTATKTYTYSQIKHSTMKGISYTNENESETVTGYILEYKEPIAIYTVTAVANPFDGGEVEGNGAYSEGEKVTLVATANDGYVFTNWTENGTEVSTDATYVFEVKENCDLVANFETIHSHNYNTYGYCSDCQVNISDVSITVGASLSVNYYIDLIDLSLVNDGESLVMKFTKNGKTTDIINGELQTSGLYKFVYENVAPQCMADTIDSALYIANGDTLTQIADNMGYTVRDNAKSLLSLYSDDEELVSLVTNMLYYGKSAQEYRGYNTDNLATDGVDGLAEQGTAIPDTTRKNLVNNSDGIAKFTAVGVWFDSVNKIYVKLNTIDNVTLKVNGEAVTLSDTVYYTDGIFATEFDDEYKFELYEGEILVQTLTYSINSYVHSMKDNSKMSELVKTLYNYGLAAKAYAE